MAAIDLTTVANVREWMPSPAGSPTPSVLATQNAVLQAAITAISLDFLVRTGRAKANRTVPSQSPFVQAVSYTETYNGNGSNTQFVRNWPILSVQSLTVNGLAISASVNNSPGYVIDDKAKSIVLLNGLTYGWRGAGTNGRNVSSRFPMGSQNIVIEYTAGFAAQSITNELDTIPATPGPYTVTPDLPWLADGGVSYFSTGFPLTPVQIAPTQGQYFVNNGQYVFNAADQGQQILLNYSAPGTPPDIQLAATKAVYLMYNRRGWEGLRSLAKPESGTTSYSTWELDPSVLEVVMNYQRRAIV